MCLEEDLKDFPVQMVLDNPAVYKAALQQSSQNLVDKVLWGNFAIAQAVTSREFRDHIRLTLPDCIFITLTLTKENQLKRITERHGEDCGGELLDMMNKFAEFYEGPGEGEKNTYNIDIDEKMTPKDVMDKVLETLARKNTWAQSR